MLPAGPVNYGFTEATSALFESNAVPGGQQPGRVVRVDRNRVLVAVAEEILHLPYPVDAEVPATGDWVWLGPNRAGERSVVGVLPRQSELSRKRAFEASSAGQVLGANIDVVGVVVPVDRPLTHNRLERTLVAAWDSGATPLVIITKADLRDLADDVVGQVMLQAAGVDVVTTSAEHGDGLDEVLGHLPPSGTLVPLPGGGVLMDTPGVRGFGLFDADSGMGEMFGDLEELFGRCRFSDCAHDQEPGCAVQVALAEETLDTRRWSSYLKLQREIAALNRRHDDAARRAYQREWHQKVVVASKSQRAAERSNAERSKDRSGKRRKR